MDVPQTYGKFIGFLTHAHMEKAHGSQGTLDAHGLGLSGFVNAPQECTHSKTHCMEHRFRNMGLSENSVPLHPMVNDHYPY